MGLAPTGKRRLARRTPEADVAVGAQIAQDAIETDEALDALSEAPDAIEHRLCPPTVPHATLRLRATVLA